MTTATEIATSLERRAMKYLIPCTTTAVGGAA